ncbi:MAG: XdhC family protein [Syntrophomonas sp.]|nr:XdhC family protein [Syntrophomonas sp.]
MESNHIGDKLIIAGSGNVAINIYKIASLLGYNITVIDHRAENLTRERFPEAKQLLLGNVVELLQTCAITDTTSIVLVTYNHEFDELALHAVIKSPARYIGILGNKRKITAYLSSLQTMDIPEEYIERVHIPIGLDLGGNMAAEIALAAVAEIQAVKYKRTGGFITIKHVSNEMKRYDDLF